MHIKNAVFHEAMNILSRLGITANYDGFLYTAHAVSLAVKNPEKLHSVTNYVYPEVAAKHNTSPDNVRKSIAKIRDITWDKNPLFLSEMAQHQLKKKPRTAEFLAILTLYTSYLI